MPVRLYFSLFVVCLSLVIAAPVVASEPEPDAETQPTQLQDLDSRLGAIEKQLAAAEETDQWPTSALSIAGVVAAFVLFLVIQQSGLRRESLQRIEDLSVEHLQSLLDSAVTAPKIQQVQPEKGKAAGGESIKITGVGFSSDSRVFLGGEECTVTMLTPEEIRVTTPPQESPFSKSMELVLTTGRGNAKVVYPLQHDKLQINGGELDSGQWGILTGEGIADIKSIDVGGTALKADQFRVISDRELFIQEPTKNAAKDVVVTVVRKDGDKGTAKVEVK